MLAQLWIGSRRMGNEARLDDRMRNRLPRIVLASALMGGVLLGLAHLMATPLADPVWRYGALAALIGAGIVSYFGSGVVLGAFRPADFKGLRRQR